MNDEKDEAAEEQAPLVIQKVQEKFTDAVLEVADKSGELTIVVRKNAVHDLMKFLKTDAELAFNYLVDITAVDYSLMEDVLMKYDYARFMVVYHLCSLKNKNRLRVKVPIHEKEPHLRSMSDVWKAANWLERETYDMFGITFDDHPDLRRILMPDDYEGHPLRKDYPLRGRGERETFNFERQNA